MPYLNFREAKIEGKILPHSDLENQMSLDMSTRNVHDLATRLKAVFEENSGELRVDLPKNWILFWKHREDESRLLLAHPDKDEWVATLALERGHGMAVAEKLSSAEIGDTIQVSSLGTLGSVSNVEILIQVIE